MSELPEPEQLRALVRGFDERQRKIITAMVAAMIEHSHRVREREWVSEQFARTVAIALDVGEDPDLASGPAGVERVREYAQQHASVLLPAAFDVFGSVALTLQQRGGPITAEAAMAEVLTYTGT